MIDEAGVVIQAIYQDPICGTPVDSSSIILTGELADGGAGECITTLPP